jgi:hypothetical protein
MVIELTDEMRRAFTEIKAAVKGCDGLDDGDFEGVAAVLAIVERDYLRVDGVHRDGRTCRPGNLCVYCSPESPP